MKKYFAITAIFATVYMANTGRADTTETLTRLQTEYRETAQKLQDTQAHLYRLEGAISILQTVEADRSTSASF